MKPVEKVGVDGHAIAGVGLTIPILRWLDGTDDLQPVLGSEVPVALVLARHGHDRTGAVTHEHVVSDVDRDTLAVDGVDCVGTSEDPGLAAFRHPLHL